MSTERNKTIARRFSEELISKGNMAVADELLAENYINHNPVGNQQPGREGFKAALGGLRAAFPDLQETIEDIVAEGDKVVVRGVRRGTHKGQLMGIPASGKPVAATKTYILRVADGKITDAWLNWDMLSVLQKIGAVPS